MKDRGIDDFLSKLSLIDLERDLQAVDSAISALKGHNCSWLIDLGGLREFLDSCRKVSVMSVVPSHCNAQLELESNPSLKTHEKFVRSLQLHSYLTWLKSNPSNPLDVLLVLSRLEHQNYAGSQGKEIADRALSQLIIRKTSEVSSNHIPANVSRMLSAISSKNDELSSLVGRFYAKLAISAYNQGEKERAAGWMQKTYETSQAASDELLELESLVENDYDFMRFYEANSSQTPSSLSTKMQRALLLIAVAISLLILLVFLRARRKKTKTA